MMRDAELRDLIASAMNGDNLAMEKLFESCQKMIYLTALDIVTDFDLADDVVQETFISIRCLSPHNAPKENAKSWLITVARNTAISFLRKRDHTSPEFDEDTTPQPDSDMLDDLDLRIDLQRSLSSLSELERRVVLLKAAGLRHQEIAGIVGKNTSTVRTIFSTAIERLRSNLSGGAA